MTVLNPQGFSFTDSKAASESVTGFKILVGTVTGGPYTTASFPLTSAEDAAGMSSGNFSGTLASIGDNLPAGNYFAVVVAVNAVGQGAASNEFAFQVLGVPSAPVNFSLA